MSTLPSPSEVNNSEPKPVPSCKPPGAKTASFAVDSLDEIGNTAWYTRREIAAVLDNPPAGADAGDLTELALVWVRKTWGEWTERAMRDCLGHGATPHDVYAMMLDKMHA